MSKNIESFFNDEGFEEFTQRDNREIEKITSEKDDKIDIYKCDVHPIHLLEDLKHLYDANGIQWYQNEYGNVLARGETSRATPYVFYVNWESATTVYYWEERSSPNHIQAHSKEKRERAPKGRARQNT